MEVLIRLIYCIIVLWLYSVKNLSQNLLQSWELAVFLHFLMIKIKFFAFLIKLIWLGVDFLNRNGTEIGYRVIVLKKYVLSIKKKYRKCPALVKKRGKSHTCIFKQFGRYTN